ncbi:MAG: NADH-quinone oxidoreductase subunit C [Anaerolineales bacterium]|nr:NADH-quinone oxidoreductase subunit C [Anaerolineales bacterium]
MDTQTVLETSRMVLEVWTERFETPAENRLDVYLKDAKNLVPAVVGLLVKRLGYLVAITGLDPEAEAPMLEILYHFCAGPAVVTLRVNVPKDNAKIASLCEVLPSAEPQERELREMFGVEVVGLHNPEFLYLPDDWDQADYPLRKDFAAVPAAEKAELTDEL